MSLTTDPKDPKLGHGVDKDPIPQNEVYLVLSEEERAKGFIRPVRTSYVHIGKKIELKGGKARKLNKKELEFYKEFNWYGYIKYPKSERPLVGIYLTKEEYENIGKYVGGCRTLTIMNRIIAETYARDPKFYGATYCMGCQKHLPVEEFVWEGTNEIVGS
jgi:hypothetical protein